MFHAVPNGQKCLREEVRQNVLIVGEIEVDHQPNQKVDYVVRFQSYFKEDKFTQGFVGSRLSSLKFPFSGLG